MSTHITKCVVCGKDCYCSEETAALGAGGSGCIYEDETPTAPIIDFCSEDCFHELDARMKMRWEIYMEIKNGI